MGGKYCTPSVAKAQANYHKKLKESGINRSHGNYERNKHTIHINNTIKLIKYLFNNALY